MGMRTNESDKLQKQMYTVKSENQKLLSNSKDFPNCNGLYPDCPTTPDLLTSMCRTCPKTDGLKKTRISD
ncbi:MAG: hypothetical protein WCW44_00115 [archaeon]